jgi:hypothetical protein
MARVWNVRLNVDAWNAGLSGLDDDSDRVAFLSGFNAGLNGRPTSPKGEAWESGWKVGNASHLEAVAFSAVQRERVSKRYRGSTVVEPTYNHGATVVLPNHNPQSTNEVTNKQQSKRARTAFTQPTLEEVSTYCAARGRGVDPERWMNFYESKGWMVGKTKMRDWQAAVRTWEPSLPKRAEISEDEKRRLTAEAEALGL